MLILIRILILSSDHELELQEKKNMIVMRKKNTKKIKILCEKYDIQN